MLSSCFASILVQEDLYAVYNTLLADPVFVTSLEYNNLLSGNVSSDLQDLLYKKGIYSRSEDDDNSRINYARNNVKSNAGINNFVMLMMADYCNLSCDYCMEKQYDIFHGKRMSKEVIDSLFHMILSNNIKLSQDVEFIIYGGEPLLNLETTLYFLNKRKEHLPNTKCSIVTNAVLLTPEIIEILKSHHVTIGISIDGPKEITDAHRKYKSNNKSVFDDVQMKIPLLFESGINWGMSITITDELMKHKDSFYDWISRIKPKSVAFNLLKLAYNSSEKDKAIEYYRKAAGFSIEAYNKLTEDNIAEKDIFRKITCFTLGHPVFSDCAATSLNQIVITPIGNIHTCQCYMNEANCLGNVFTPSSYSIPQVSLDIFNNLPVYKEKCLKCCALPICGGGCLIQGQLLYKNDQYIDQGYCEYAKIIMRWIYNRLYTSVV